MHDNLCKIREVSARLTSGGMVVGWMTTRAKSSSFRPPDVGRNGGGMYDNAGEILEFPPA